MSMYDGYEDEYGDGGGGGGGGAQPDIYDLPTSGGGDLQWWLQQMYGGGGSGGGGTPAGTGFDPNQPGYGVGFSATGTGSTGSNGGGGGGFSYSPYPNLTPNETGGGGGGLPPNQQGGATQPGSDPLKPISQTPVRGSAPSTSNTTNNISTSNSVALPSSTYASSAPDPPKFQYTPISNGTSQAPPLTPLNNPAPAQPPPSTPGMQSKGLPGASQVTFGAPKSNTPSKASSTLGKIAGLMGVNPRYKALYDALRPPRKLTPEQLVENGQAAAYRDTYGLGQ